MAEPIKPSTSDFVLASLPLFLSAPALLIVLGASVLTCFVGNNSPLLISMFGLPACVVMLVFSVAIRIKNRDSPRLRRVSTFGVINSGAVVLLMILMLFQFARKEYKSNQERQETHMNRMPIEGNHEKSHP